MNTATHIEMQNLAKQAADYITKLNGESKTFEIEGDTLTAIIEYKAEIGYDKGDYWTAPCWWIERETADVKAVYNTEGEDNAEAAEWLKKMLN